MCFKNKLYHSQMQTSCKIARGFEQLNHVLYIEEGIDQDEAAALKMNSTLSFEEKNENVGESKKIIY